MSTIDIMECGEVSCECCNKDKCIYMTDRGEDKAESEGEMTRLKYPKELYTGSGFFDGDMDCEYTNRTEKLVKCRKTHKCVNCQKRINIGDYTVVDKALFPSDGWKSCYICTKCIEEWLEESGQVESEDKE